MSVKPGIDGICSIGGTEIVMIRNCNLEVSRETEEQYTTGGTCEPQDVTRGKISYRLSATKGFIIRNYLDLVRGTANLIGTFLPRGGTVTYLAGTVVLTRSRISFANEAAACIEDIEGILYNVSVG